MLYQTLPAPGVSAAMLAEALANRLTNLPELKIVARRTEKVADESAARVEVIAPGTGDALAPSGVGTPVAPEGKRLEPTRQVTVGIVRSSGPLFLSWHHARIGPCADRPGYRGDPRQPETFGRHSSAVVFLLNFILDSSITSRAGRVSPARGSLPMSTPVRPTRDRAGRVYTPAIGSRLRPLLWIVLIGFALLAANGFYLSSVTALTWYLGTTQQTFFYMLMVALHLALGLALVVPFLIFGFAHLVSSWKRPNKQAIRYGLALLTAGLVTVVSGFILVRIGGFEVRDPRVRNIGYWFHVAAPLLAIALYVKHRLAGPRIRWEWARRLAMPVAGFVAVMGLLHFQDPRSFGVKGPRGGQAVLLSVRSRHRQRQVHPGQDADDGRLLHEVPPGRLQRLVSLIASPQLVQQQGLPDERARDEEGLARARRLDPGCTLVRGLSRPGAVLLGRIRRSQL